MHEIGLCDTLLKMVTQIVEDDNAKVISITVEIGELSGVLPSFMADCWKAVVDRTPYKDTNLIIKIDKGRLFCKDCNTYFNGDLQHLKCPACNGQKLIPVGGKEMTLLEILCE